MNRRVTAAALAFTALTSFSAPAALAAPVPVPGPVVSTPDVPGDDLPMPPRSKGDPARPLGIGNAFCRLFPAACGWK